MGIRFADRRCLFEVFDALEQAVDHVNLRLQFLLVLGRLIVMSAAAPAASSRRELLLVLAWLLR